MTDPRRPGYLEYRPRTRSELELRRHAARTRRRIRRIDALIIVAAGVLFGLLLLAWLTPNAGAYSYPGERPARGELVDQAVEVGYGFWQDRHVAPCPRERLEVLVAPDLGGADYPGNVVPERAELGGCRLWVAAWVLRAARRELAWITADARRYGRNIDSAAAGVLDVCTVIAHGLGHNAGLGHTRRGIMAEALSDDGVPFACRQWTRRIVRSTIATAARAARKQRQRARSHRN